MASTETTKINSVGVELVSQINAKINQKNHCKSSNTSPNAYKSALFKEQQLTKQEKLSKINRASKWPQTKQPKASKQEPESKKFTTISAPTTYRTKRRSKRSKSPNKNCNASKENDPLQRQLAELQSKYDELQKKHIALKSKIKISEWKWFDVYDFIIDLDIKSLFAYKQDLYDNLKIHLT